jgi:predicted secreted protein
MRLVDLGFAYLLAISTAALAQGTVPAAPAQGTLVVMTGSAEIEVPNDEAVASFFYEAQDADLARAQALVNQRVADGTAALRRADPKAQLETSGYGSYPVYGQNNRSIVGWRVRQGVTLRTADLAALPRTVAAAQPLLSLGGIDFRLSRAARERIEGDLIQQAIANLNGRVAAAAQALGVPRERVRLEEVNFVGRDGGPVPVMARMAMAADAAPPPQFESGRSVERVFVTGRARLLP